MKNIQRDRLVKYLGITLFLLSLWLFLILPPARAEMQNQTIPTMPPTSGVSPTVTPSEMATNPPQPTVTTSLPTNMFPSQIVTLTASATAMVVDASQSAVPSVTAMPGGQTIPVFTNTFQPTLTSQISTAVVQNLTITPSIETGNNDSSVELGVIIGVGMAFVILIGIGSYIYSRRKEQG